MNSCRQNYFQIHSIFISFLPVKELVCMWRFSFVIVYSFLLTISILVLFSSLFTLISAILCDKFFLSLPTFRLPLLIASIIFVFFKYLSSKFWLLVPVLPLLLLFHFSIYLVLFRTILFKYHVYSTDKEQR